MIKIREIAYTVYPVKDAGRSRIFYESTLGLTPTKSFEKNGKHWIEYDIGAGTLGITDMTDDNWQPTKHGAATAVEVEDFDEAVRWLKSQSVIFQTEPWESPVCRMATVYDPDRNCLAIHKAKPVPVPTP
jgi:predicted enzyme related to lactoylglutathione lyase